MKRLMTVMLSVLFAAGLCGKVVAGSIDSHGLPTAGSGMYTLLQIYDYLNSGTVAPTPGPFQEPSAGPGSTMKTTREVYDDIKAKLDQCNITADNVELGKTFFCTQSGSWGVQTGTLVALPRPTATPTITATPPQTITPTPTVTPTNTPTATPTWGQVACEGVGGWWAPLNGGLQGSGCWLKSEFRKNCNATCNPLGLVCDSRNWGDNGSCLILAHFFSCSDCVNGSGSPEYEQALPGSDGTHCREDGLVGPQSCDARCIPAGMEEWGWRPCVCERTP